jgi:hypothetical protein
MTMRMRPMSRPRSRKRHRAQADQLACIDAILDRIEVLAAATEEIARRLSSRLEGLGPAVH